MHALLVTLEPHLQDYMRSLLFRSGPNADVHTSLAIFHDSTEVTGLVET
jgi:hypothetical protein